MCFEWDMNGDAIRKKNLLLLARKKLSYKMDIWNIATFLGTMWREYRKEGERRKDCFFPLKNPDWSSAVRLEAVFYGPVGEAHCLLKWCFSCPNMTKAQHTEPVGEGGQAGGAGVQEEEEKGGEERRKRLTRMCVFTCMFQESATTAC